MLLRVLLSVLLVTTLPAVAARNDNLSADEAIVAARDAARNDEAARLAALAERVKGHPLEDYVEFWELIAHLHKDDGAATDAAVLAFINSRSGSFMADRLRREWLLALGKRGDFATYLRERPALIWDDEPQIRCYTLLARYQKDEKDEKDGGQVAREARQWLADSRDSNSEACTALANALLASGRLSAWERVRALVEQGHPAAAKRVAAQIKDRSAKLVDQAIDSPVRFLALRDRRGSATQRELAMIAIARAAADDPAQAARLAAELSPQLSAQQRADVWGRIGHQAATKLMPEAVDWYRRGGDLVGLGPDAVRSTEVLEWQVRAALRGDRSGTDWKMVRTTIERMPPDLARESAWVYWRARALQAEKKDAEAAEGFRSLAGKFDFYGKLSLEELGQSPSIPARAEPATPDEVAAMAKLPGFIRAQAFYRLGLRLEGHREWNWQLRGMNDRQLLAAAEFARSASILDRMISTSDRTRSEFDFTQRFPSPHRAELTQQARAANLDESWIYGLIRQESRFIHDVRSGAGAQGLMQLMPATARLVARKIGMSDFTPGRVNELDVNLRLGTSYLRMVLDQLDGQWLLATAGYNAGPGRPRAWRAALARPVEGAIFAETIPFGETRGYVKNVLSNAIDYANLFGGKPMPLKERLGVIAPKMSADTDAQ